MERGKKIETHEFYDVYEKLNDAGGEPIMMRTAYSKDGVGLSTPKLAQNLVKRGITEQFEPIFPDGDWGQIGFNPTEQKWYGWARAIWGYGIGAVAKEGDTCTIPGMMPHLVAKHPEKDLSVPVGFVAKTLEDAKRMARAHAESCS